MAGINHQPLKIRLINQSLKQRFPYARVTPTTKPSVRVFPIAVTLGQIAPGRPGAQNPEHRIDKSPIILRYTAPPPLLSRQMRLQ